VALVVEGSDCEKVGLVPSKPFCVAAKGSCATTTYALRGMNCRVAQYQLLLQGSECPAGTPTFVGPAVIGVAGLEEQTGAY
jgi:hypothetical protein